MGKTPRAAKSAPAGKRSTRKNANESENTTKNVAAALAASLSPRASRLASRSAKESEKIILTADQLRLTQEQQFAKAAKTGEDDGRGEVNKEKMFHANKPPPETLVAEESPPRP